MSRATRFVVAAIVFALLAAICLVMDVPRIQEDIRTRSADVLATAGLSDLGMDVVGRDVSLTGTRIQIDRARGALASVEGIRRTAVIPITESTPTPSPILPPTTVQPAPAEAVENGIRALIAGRPIRFRTGSAVLLAESRTILDELATLLRTTSFNIEIEGHTDATGSAVRNLRLSQERAESVMAYLAGQGVSASRMTATGVGAARPIATNATAAGRERNRRIEFNVTSPN